MLKGSTGGSSKFLLHIECCRCWGVNDFDPYASDEQPTGCQCTSWVSWSFPTHFAFQAFFVQRCQLGNPGRLKAETRHGKGSWVVELIDAEVLVESHRASPHHRCFMLATKNQGSSNFTKWMSYEGSDHWNDPKDTKNMAAKSKTPLSKPMPRASHVAAYWSPPSCREQFLRWSLSLSGSSTKGSNPMTTGPLGPPTDAICDTPQKQKV